MAGGEVEGIPSLPVAHHADGVVGADLCMGDRSAQELRECVGAPLPYESAQCSLGITARRVDEYPVHGFILCIREIDALTEGCHAVSALKA